MRRKNRFFIITGILLAPFVVIALLAAILHVLPQPTYPVKVFTIQVNTTPERVAEGRRIVLMTCAKCHYNESTNALSGNLVPNPMFTEDNWSANITADTITGIGKWTDAQLAFLLRTGLRPDGTFFYDMPKYPLLSDEDLYSIIAYLRSNDSLVSPTKSLPVNNKPGIISRFFYQWVFKPYKYPDAPINTPDTNNLMLFGKYLATAKFSCYECHSHELISNYHHNKPEMTRNYFAGGTPHADRQHNEVISANLTPDNETGIGQWSERDFDKALRNGIKPDGTTVREPMYPFYLLTDREVKAIYTYLHSLPPVHLTRHDYN